jgi:hypothetical protein
MAKKAGKRGKLGIPGSKKGIISICLVLIAIGVSIWGITSGVFGGARAGNSQQTNTGARNLAQPVSPLLFGTNLGLFNSNDQVLVSATTRSMLQQIHTRIIRMPVRSSLSEATEVQAAQIIKNLGATPLVVLRGAVDSNVLADDSRIVNDMNRIFGNSVVYYEYGNEEDLLGVDVNGYTASWNAVVPQLKRLVLHGQFVGPVNFQYNRTYLTTFLQRANPRPDEVSWHEYTCDDSWASSICISHIANWTRHFNDARAAMTATIGTALPIMITEWNYAPNAVPNDGKNNNPAFMSTWTALALQTMATNGIYASMQYSVTNTAIPLISTNNALTTQGAAFLSQYQVMITEGKQPIPAPTTSPLQPQPPGQGNGNTPEPIPTTSPNTFSSFSFEDGSTDGWSGHSSQITLVQNSASVGRGDSHSLRVTINNIQNGDFPFVSVGHSNLATYPHMGQTVAMYIYVPASSPGIEAKVFVMDYQYHWFDRGAMTSLKPGVWNRLTFTLPGAVSGQLRQLGVQFTTPANAPVSATVYIDAVGWS